MIRCNDEIQNKQDNLNPYLRPGVEWVTSPGQELANQHCSSSPLSIYDNFAWVHRGQHLIWPSTFPSKLMRPLGRLWSSIRSKDDQSRFCRYGWQQIFCLGRRLDLPLHASKNPPCSLRFDHLLQFWTGVSGLTDGVGVVWFNK